MVTANESASFFNEATGAQRAEWEKRLATEKKKLSDSAIPEKERLSIYIALRDLGYEAYRSGHADLAIESLSLIPSDVRFDEAPHLEARLKLAVFSAIMREFAMKFIYAVEDVAVRMRFRAQSEEDQDALKEEVQGLVAAPELEVFVWMLSEIERDANLKAQVGERKYIWKEVLFSLVRVSVFLGTRSVEHERLRSSVLAALATPGKKGFTEDALRAELARLEAFIHADLDENRKEPHNVLNPSSRLDLPRAIALLESAALETQDGKVKNAVIVDALFAIIVSYQYALVEEGVSSEDLARVIKKIRSSTVNSSGAGILQGILEAVRKEEAARRPKAA